LDIQAESQSKAPLFRQGHTYRKTTRPSFSLPVKIDEIFVCNSADERLESEGGDTRGSKAALVYDVGDTSQSFSSEVEEDEVVHEVPNLVGKLISKWDLNGQSQNHLGVSAHCFLGQHREEKRTRGRYRIIRAFLPIAIGSRKL
jgi:hypothetical protein